MREQILKKSELNIKNMYDYGRITRHHEQFIPCSLQEKDENIIFQFDSLMEDYQIELASANLFYDANYKVKALMRDVYPDGKEPDRDDNLKKEKAICAYVLQTRYSYEDYYEGGMKLLKRSKLLKEIYEKTDSQQIRDCLNQKRKQIIEDKEMHMNRQKYIVVIG